MSLTEQGHFVAGPTAAGGLYLLGFPAEKIKERFPIAKIFEHAEESDLETFSGIVKSRSEKLALLDYQIDIDLEEDLHTLVTMLPAIRNTLSELDQPDANYNFNYPEATAETIEQLGLGFRKNKNNNRKQSLTRLTNTE